TEPSRSRRASTWAMPRIFSTRASTCGGPSLERRARPLHVIRHDCQFDEIVHDASDVDRAYVDACFAQLSAQARQLAGPVLQQHRDDFALFEWNAVLLERRSRRLRIVGQDVDRGLPVDRESGNGLQVD